jgi:hypothetical protein
MWRRADCIVAVARVSIVCNSTWLTRREYRIHRWRTEPSINAINDIVGWDAANILAGNRPTLDRIMAAGRHRPGRLSDDEVLTLLMLFLDTTETAHTEKGWNSRSNPLRETFGWIPRASTLTALLETMGFASFEDACHLLTRVRRA